MAERRRLLERLRSCKKPREAYMAFTPLGAEELAQAFRTKTPKQPPIRRPLFWYFPEKKSLG